MRGIRFSMLLALPFVLGTLYAGINLIYLGKESHLFWLLGFLVVTIGIFLAGAELNYWYDKKYPPKLDPPIINWLERYFPFYNALYKDEKIKFETRLALYLNARLFKLMIKDTPNIPEDFKGIIAAHGIRMTMGLDDFLIGDFDRIICYNHPFPTPQNRFLHTVETHKEDGVILLSIEQFMQSVGHPNSNYNIAYHAYSEALISLYPQLKNLDDDHSWELISKILPYDLLQVKKLTGFESPDINTVALASFFINNESFKEKWTEQYSHYKDILHYDF